MQTGLALNQVRLADGDGRLNDRELLALHEQLPLLVRDQQALAQSSLSLGDGLFLSLDASGGTDSTVGYRAKKKPADRSDEGRGTALAGLLGAHPPGGKAADRARARGLLPAAVG